MKGSYYPSYPPDWEPPRKRRRQDERTHENSSRTRYYGKGESYRPSGHRDDRRNQNTEQHRSRPNRPSAPRHKTNDNPDLKANAQPRQTPARTANTTNENPTTHTRKERKQNRSTQVASLRKLLATDILPPEPRREKERELAGLLFDQEKDRIATATSQMIRRYHMVRFFERKKAERKFKRLRKARAELEQSQTMDEKELHRLDQDIHETAVDLNYTQYAPLAEKYISIFAVEGKDKEKDNKADAEQEANRRLPSETQAAAFTEEQQKELQQLHDRGTNVARLNVQGFKPPVWDEVKTCMDVQAVEGTAEEKQKVVTSKLEALRDRKLTAMEGLAVRSENILGFGAGQKRRPKWLDDDGDVVAQDVDSEDDEDGGVKLDGDDETISNGSFFE